MAERQGSTLTEWPCRGWAGGVRLEAGRLWAVWHGSSSKRWQLKPCVDGQGECQDWRGGRIEDRSVGDNCPCLAYFTGMLWWENKIKCRKILKNIKKYWNAIDLLIGEYIVIFSPRDIFLTPRSSSPFFFFCHYLSLLQTFPHSNLEFWKLSGMAFLEDYSPRTYTDEAWTLEP